MLDLGIVKKDFSSLIGNIHPWMLSHFVMWLDIKVAEYKVYGHMVLDDTPNDTPSWLRSHTRQKTTDGSHKTILSLDNEHEQMGPEHSSDVNTYSQTHTDRVLSSLTRFPKTCKQYKGTSETGQNVQNYETLTGNNGVNKASQEHLVVQNIQLQEQWSKEIEKSLQLSHIMSVDGTSPEEIRTESLSRSTIVLSDPKEIQKNDRIDSPNSVDGNSAKIEPDVDIIKIEVSSNDGNDQCESLEYIQGNRLADLDHNLFATEETDINDIQDVSSDMNNIHTLENTENIQNSSDSTEKKSSWRSKKWDYFERLRKSQKSNYDGARVHSRSIQDQLPFPKPFPLTNLTYGLRALQMISTGVVTRPGKMQFLDTVFNEIVKYTGLYPTPQQKQEVAEAICTTFPKLDAKHNPGQGSSVTQWLNILKDKFRNERRMLHHGPYLSRQRIPGSQYLMTNSGMSGVS